MSFEEGFLEGLLKICTLNWTRLHIYVEIGDFKTYVKLPSFDMFASFFTGDNNNKLRDLATSHPLVELGHDLLDVGFDLVVRGNCPSCWHQIGKENECNAQTQHIEAIFLDTRINQPSRMIT